MIFFREETAKNYNLDLLVHINEEGVRDKISPITHGSKIHTDIMKTQALKQALDKYRFDAAFGGARRDEENHAQKKEFFHFEIKAIVGILKIKNQSFGIYLIPKLIKMKVLGIPLSNWTEIDVWQYIYQEKIPIVPLYFAKQDQ